MGFGFIWLPSMCFSQVLLPSAWWNWSFWSAPASSSRGARSCSAVVSRSSAQWSPGRSGYLWRAGQRGGLERAGRLGIFWFFSKSFWLFGRRQFWRVWNHMLDSLEVVSVCEMVEETVPVNCGEWILTTVVNMALSLSLSWQSCTSISDRNHPVKLASPQTNRFFAPKNH